MDEFKKLTPFRAFCNKIIPTMYDDSLSYYELLSKILKYVNDLIDNTNALKKGLDDLEEKEQAHFDEMGRRLTEFYNVLFNLIADLENEIPEKVENKINEMYESGEFDIILKNYMRYEMGAPLSGADLNDFTSLGTFFVHGASSSNIPIYPDIKSWIGMLTVINHLRADRTERYVQEYTMLSEPFVKFSRVGRTSLEVDEILWTDWKAEAETNGKIELVYDGNEIKYKENSVSFADIVNYLKNSPSFTYMLYNDRAYLPTLISIDNIPNYIYFVSTAIDGGMSKNAIISIYSSNGENISSVSHTNVANENVSRKVSEINERNMNDGNAYPSNSAVTKYFTSKAETNKVVNAGSKNILKPHAIGTYEKNGRVHTFNEDGTVEIEGTATATTFVYYYGVGTTSVQAMENIGTGDFILSSNALNDSPDNTQIALYVRNVNDTSRYFTHRVINEDYKFTLIEGDRVAITLRTGNGISEEQFLAPMLRRFGDNTYTPYAPSNRELYETIHRELLYSGNMNKSQLSEGENIFLSQSTINVPDCEYIDIECEWVGNTVKPFVLRLIKDSTDANLYRGTYVSFDISFSMQYLLYMISAIVNKQTNNIQINLPKSVPVFASTYSQSTNAFSNVNSFKVKVYAVKSET